MVKIARSSTSGGQIPSRSLTENELQAYELAQKSVNDFAVGALAGGEKPAFTFIACFDGTNNDQENPLKGLPTSIGRFKEQLQEVQLPQHVRFGYVPGVGTGAQEGSLVNRLGNSVVNSIVDVADLATGFSYKSRALLMYVNLCQKYKEWRRDNPGRNDPPVVVSTGFSRGAGTAAYFTRLIHKFGLIDPNGISMTPSKTGVSVYFKPNTRKLSSPGLVKQAALLYDSVTTGSMAKKNLEIPPSVEYVLQIRANDEFRDAFPFRDHLTENKVTRSLSLDLAGSHCDIGGSYANDQLSTRNFNFGIDFLKKLGLDFFSYREPEFKGEPQIHNSSEISPFSSTPLKSTFLSRINYPSNPMRVVFPSNTIEQFLRNHANNDSLETGYINRQLFEELSDPGKVVGPLRPSEQSVVRIKNFVDWEIGDRPEPMNTRMTAEEIGRQTALELERCEPDARKGILSQAFALCLSLPGEGGARDSIVQSFIEGYFKQAVQQHPTPSMADELFNPDVPLMQRMMQTDDRPQASLMKMWESASLDYLGTTAKKEVKPDRVAQWLDGVLQSSASLEKMDREVDYEAISQMEMSESAREQLFAAASALERYETKNDVYDAEKAITDQQKAEIAAALREVSLAYLSMCQAEIEFNDDPSTRQQKVLQSILQEAKERYNHVVALGAANASAVAAAEVPRTTSTMVVEPQKPAVPEKPFSLESKPRKFASPFDQSPFPKKLQR